MLQFCWCCAEYQILSLPVPFPIFSTFSPKQLALIGPPIPYSPLHLSLPSLHPASCPLDTPAAQCLPPAPPSLPLAMVTWCLNSSSLNSAASTNFPFLLYMTPKGVQEKRTEVLENKVDRLWVSNAFSECFDLSGTWMKVSKALTVTCERVPISYESLNHL